MLQLFVVAYCSDETDPLMERDVLDNKNKLTADVRMRSFWISQLDQ